MSQIKQFNLVKSCYLPHQWEYLTSKSNRLCLAAGYRAGKTFTFLRKALICHLTKINAITGKSNGWVIYPTFDLAEEIFIEPFCELMEKLYITYNYNISKHRIDTPFGRIRIFSLQNPNRIVGGNLTWCGADEFDVESVDRCMRTYRKAIARLSGCVDAPFFTVSTLEGYKAVYDIFFDKPSPEKHLIQASSEDNPYLPEGYIDSLKLDYDELMQEMYIHGRPVNLNGSAAYYKFIRDIHVKPCKDKDLLDTQGKHYLPLWIGIDFNVSPMSAGVSVMVDGISYQIAEYHISVGNTRLLCELILQDYPGRYVIACPDMTSNIRNTLVSYSDIDILRNAGFEIMGNTNRTQRDRLNIVNNLLEKQKIVIDPDCKFTIRDRERVIIKDNVICKDDAGKGADSLTHNSDAMDQAYIQQFKPTYTDQTR
jgi:hypothetical protein